MFCKYASRLFCHGIFFVSASQLSLERYYDAARVMSECLAYLCIWKNIDAIFERTHHYL